MEGGISTLFPAAVGSVATCREVPAERWDGGAKAVVVERRRVRVEARRFMIDAVDVVVRKVDGCGRWQSAVCGRKVDGRVAGGRQSAVCGTLRTH